jgi:hypothetical protein
MPLVAPRFVQALNAGTAGVSPAAPWPFTLVNLRFVLPPLAGEGACGPSTEAPHTLSSY